MPPICKEASLIPLPMVLSESVSLSHTSSLSFPSSSVCCKGQSWQPPYLWLQLCKWHLQCWLSPWHGSVKSDAVVRWSHYSPASFITMMFRNHIPMPLGPSQSQELEDRPQQTKVTKSSWHVWLHYWHKPSAFIFFLYRVLTSPKWR